MLAAMITLQQVSRVTDQSRFMGHESACQDIDGRREARLDGLVDRGIVLALLGAPAQWKAGRGGGGTAALPEAPLAARECWRCEAA